MVYSLEELNGERVLVKVEALVPSETEDSLPLRKEIEVVLSRVVLLPFVSHHHSMKFVLGLLLVAHVSVSRAIMETSWPFLSHLVAI